MKTWNTRPWSTPVTIGAGIFVAATGLTMFFITERPFKFAHELGGISFSAAILLHVLSHRRSFTNYFRQRGALGIVVTAWAIGVGLVAASSVLNMGEAEALIVDRIDNAPRHGRAAGRRSAWRRGPRCRRPGDVHSTTGSAVRRRHG